MNPESKSHCESTEHLLSAFALGEATEAEKEIVNAHVASCSACREQLALLSKTAQLVAQSAPQGVELESAQRQRILDAARQAKLVTASSEQRKPRTSRRILTLSLLSVAALALGGVGIWIFQEWSQNAALDVAERQDAGRALSAPGDKTVPAAFRARSEADSPRDAATGLDGTLTASVANKPDPTRAGDAALAFAPPRLALSEREAVEVSVAGGAGLPVAEVRKETLLAQAPTDVPQGTHLDSLTNRNTDFAWSTNSTGTGGYVPDTTAGSLATGGRGQSLEPAKERGRALGRDDLQESLQESTRANFREKTEQELAAESAEGLVRLKSVPSLGVEPRQQSAASAAGQGLPESGAAGGVPIQTPSAGSYGSRRSMEAKGKAAPEARRTELARELELDELRSARVGTTPDEIQLQKLEDKDRYYARARPEEERMPAPDAGSRPLDAASKSRAGGAAAAKPAESSAAAGSAQPKDAKGLAEQSRAKKNDGELTTAPAPGATPVATRGLIAQAPPPTSETPAPAKTSASTSGPAPTGATPATQPAPSSPTPAPAAKGPEPAETKFSDQADGAARSSLATGARPAASGDVAAPATPAASVTSPPPSFYKQKVDEFLTRLDRRPGETPDMMFFRYWGDNPFTETASDHLSTFGVDVDTASYAITRAYLYKQGMLPPREAVRTEEFLNYFAGGYAPPTEEGRPFSIHAEAASTPFAHESEYKLLRIGVKGREVAREKRKACSLVFVIDTSGSMRRENRLELVKDALRLLVPELDEGDSIGIVAFDFEARAVLEPVPASEREKILDAIGRLEPRRNTNVGAGLELGFRMAASKLVRDGMNRVILLSDGVANTGVTDPNAMLEQVRGQRDLGVYLSTVGVGMGNLNDTLLEQLADRGNGRCVYVDRIEEAKKAFVEGLTGSLETIAKDVKIQVDFDPEKVLRYRLLGYENRAIADADFRNARVDAGEVGAGHEVTALYELKLKTDAGGALPAGRVATVRVRSKTPDFGEVQEFERVIDASSFKASFAEAAPRFRLQACAAEFAEVLRDSYWARGGSLGKVATTLSDLLDLRQSENGPRLGDDPDVLELLALVKRAEALVQARDAQKDDVARTVDAIKENRFLQARVEQELLRRGEEQRNQLDEIRHQNDLLRRRLEDLLAR